MAISCHVAFAEEGDHLTLKAPSELKEIKVLRDRWLNSLVRESKKTHEIYLDDLKKLKSRLDKQEKWDDSKEVQKELNHSHSSEPHKIKLAFAKKPDKAVPRLRFARTIYQRKFKELLKRKRTGYLISLKKLESELQAENKTKDAAKVSREIELVTKGFSVFELSTDGKPNNAEELKKWLLVSKWEIQRLRGEDKQRGKLRFYPDGQLDMPWTKPNSKVIWQVRGPRTFRMIQENRRWVYEMKISDDMRTLTGHAVTENGSGSVKEAVYWVGEHL